MPAPQIVVGGLGSRTWTDAIWLSGGLVKNEGGATPLGVGPPAIWFQVNELESHPSYPGPGFRLQIDAMAAFSDNPRPLYKGLFIKGGYAATATCRSMVETGQKPWSLPNLRLPGIRCAGYY